MTNGVQQGRALRLRPGLNRIGRSVDNDLQIPDASVSGWHCELSVAEEGVRVRDLDSTNGTWLNGTPVQEEVIEAGQTLTVGEIDLKLEEAPQPGNGPVIDVPEVFVGQKLVSAVLPDGSPGCVNHPVRAAAFRCGQCQQTLCESCVRVVKRTSGDPMAFCSLCSGLCESLVAPEPVLATAAPPSEGFLSRLGLTLRLRRRTTRPRSARR